MPKYLTTEEAAEILRIHPYTLGKLARLGKIRSVRATPGARARRLYTMNDIEAFLAKNAAASR